MEPRKSKPLSVQKRTKMMERLLKQVESLDKVALSRQLEGVLSGGFIIAEGAVVVRNLHEKSRAVSINDFHDLTAYECFVNHVHVEEFLGSLSQQKIQLLQQGILLAYRLQSELVSQFSPADFNIIVSSDEDGCTVRFHTVRRGENWLSPDLERYEMEAILVIRTSKPTRKGKE